MSATTTTTSNTPTTNGMFNFSDRDLKVMKYRFGVSGLGFAAGLGYAFYKKKKFWGYVGHGILFSLIGGAVGWGIGELVVPADASKDGGNTKTSDQSNAKTSGDSDPTGPPSDEDFNNLVSTFNRVGADTFQGATPSQMAAARSTMKKTLTKNEVTHLQQLILLGEKNWTPEQKNEVGIIFSKWLGMAWRGGDNAKSSFSGCSTGYTQNYFGNCIKNKSNNSSAFGGKVNDMMSRHATLLDPVGTKYKTIQTIATFFPENWPTGGDVPHGNPLGDGYVYIQAGTPVYRMDRSQVYSKGNWWILTKYGYEPLVNLQKI